MTGEWAGRLPSPHLEYFVFEMAPSPQ